MSHLPNFTPKRLSILTRKLHQGKTYEDFVKAWLPPVEKKDEYFECPVWVINAQAADDSSEIISIGLLDCTDEQFEQFSKNVLESELERGQRIGKVADKSGAKFYKIRDIIQLGKV